MADRSDKEKLYAVKTGNKLHSRKGNYYSVLEVLRYGGQILDKWVVP